MDNEKKLVAHIIDRLPADGAERLLVDVLKNRSSNFNYVVLCLIDGGELVEELQQMGLRVIVFKRHSKFDLSLLWRVALWLRKHKVAVVHTHLFTADSWGRTAALLARTPKIFNTVHSTNTWKNIIHRVVDNILARFSTKVIACSHTVAQGLQQRDFISDKKIVTISNGIDFERFSTLKPTVMSEIKYLREKTIKMALIGRLHPAKGHTDLLSVLAKLKQDGLNFHVFFVGEGELKNEIAEAISALDLHDYVSMLGFRRDIPNILANIDILLMPSRWEGLPITLLEAMAMAKPVLASAVGGIPDVISDGENGLLFKAGNEQELSKKLRNLLMSKDLREIYGNTAKNMVKKHYNAKVVAQKYEELYHKA
jgi:glycosyltransferase involved in cell wall biosynthesis